MLGVSFLQVGRGHGGIATYHKNTLALIIFKRLIDEIHEFWTNTVFDDVDQMQIHLVFVGKTVGLQTQSLTSVSYPDD